MLIFKNNAGQHGNEIHKARRTRKKALHELKEFARIKEQGSRHLKLRPMARHCLRATL
jgi:hypothetical protein